MTTIQGEAERGLAESKPSTRAHMSRLQTPSLLPAVRDKIMGGRGCAHLDRGFPLLLLQRLLLDHLQVRACITACATTRTRASAEEVDHEYDFDLCLRGPVRAQVTGMLKGRLSSAWERGAGFQRHSRICDRNHIAAALRTLRGSLERPQTRAWPYLRPLVPSSWFFTMTAFLPAYRPCRTITTLPGCTHAWGGSWCVEHGVEGRCRACPERWRAPSGTSPWRPTRDHPERPRCRVSSVHGARR